MGEEGPETNESVENTSRTTWSGPRSMANRLIRLHSIGFFLLVPFFFCCVSSTLRTCDFIEFLIYQRALPGRNACSYKFALYYHRCRVLSKHSKHLLRIAPLPTPFFCNTNASFLLALRFRKPPICGSLRGFDDPCRPINQNFNALSASCAYFATMSQTSPM